MSIVKQEIDQAFGKCKGTYGGVWQDYFALAYLSKEFERRVEDIAHQVAFGKNDYGIDAFHFDPNRRNLYLFQFKWSTNPQLFQETFGRLISAGMEMIFGKHSPDPEMAEVLVELKACLEENHSAIDQVLVHFVFNGDPSDAERSAVLDDLREKLEAKKFLIDERFAGRPVTLSFRYIKNPGPSEKKKTAGIIHTKKTHQHRVTFEKSISTETVSGTELHIGLIGLMDLYDIYEEMGQRLFDRNIRSGLSPEKSPNRSIRKTLARILNGQQPADEFVFNHNGVTIYAQKLDIESDQSTAMIVEPRILNGAQTITSVSEFVKTYKGKKSFQTQVESLRLTRVLAKIICKASDEFVVNATICNNRQNRVDPWHLRANDRVQLQLQDMFADSNLIYERLEGAFENMSDEYLEEWGIPIDDYKARAKPIEIKRLAQTFLAVQGEIDKISRPAEVFDTESIYSDVFRPAYLYSDVRQIVVAYKMQFRLKKIVSELVEKYPNSYWYVGHARNLVWALLIQGLFNNDADMSLAQCCKNYGRYLQIEGDFTNLLRDLLSRRVRFIISKAVSEKRIQDELELGNYRSLSKRPLFDRCMSIAQREYRWEKRPFDRATVTDDE